MKIGKPNSRQIHEKKHTQKKQRTKFHPMEYAVVIKLYEGHLTFSCPDFHYFHVIDMPKGQLDSKYLQTVAANVGKCWVKTQERLSQLNEYNVKAPLPTLIKELLKKSKYKRLGVTEVARLLERSEQTIRRLADKGYLKCKKTAKGTRYFREVDILKFKEQN
jgi:hypothetical protein